MSIQEQIAALELQLEQAVYQASLSATGLGHVVAEYDVVSLRSRIARLKKDSSGDSPERNNARVSIDLATVNPVIVTGLPQVRGIPSSAKKIVEGGTSYYLASDGTVIPADK